MLVNTEQTAKVIGVSRNAIGSLKYRKLVTPAKVAEFVTDWNLYTPEQVLAMAVLFDCRRKGATLAASLLALEFLKDLTASELEAHFAEGRDCLTLLGGMLSPMIRREQATDPSLAWLAVQGGYPLVIVHVRTLHERITAALRAGVVGPCIEDEADAAPDTSAAASQLPEVTSAA